jgi:hypothetical protein
VLAISQEVGYGLGVGPPRVAVADSGGKELGLFAGSCG